MTRVLSALLAAGLGLAAPDAQASEPATAQVTPTTRRVALIVGANDGGRARVKLRYAGTDARSLAAVLGRLGGIDRSDEVLLLDPSPDALYAGFARAAARVERARAAGERVQFLFYYSGHADDRGLLLGERRVDYPKLRALIHEVPAHVRLGMLDSCSSGAFVRTKGGRMRPPLATGDASVEGHAFLTSSSAEEAAQESDRIGGSFFTHYLVSGLRGAADVNRDRRVTLNEAYRFAFDETLAGTETTLGRAQHPAYDIQLVGSGDLVMTDLRDTSALLDIGATVGGRVYVRDAEGRLAAELYKGVGAGAVSLALEPGTYNIVVDDGASLRRATLEVRAGRKNELTHAALTPVAGEPTVARGEPPDDPGEYRVLPFGFGLVPPAVTNRIERERKVINRFALNLLLGRAAQIHGAEISTGGNWTDEDVRGVQLSAAVNYVGRDVHGFQSTGAVNVVGGSVHGVQGAGAVNVVGGDAGGLQAAGGVNVTVGVARGLQAAGGFNWARRVAGLQLAPVNAAGEVRGAQVGVVNGSGGATGTQVGVVNGSGDETRAQVGLINVSRGSVGAQVGLLNFAREARASVGLLSITRKGGVFADVWTSDVAALNVAVKFRAKYTYTFLAVGVHPAGRGRGMMFGLGFGGHVPLPRRLYLDLDVSANSVIPRYRYGDEQALLATGRALLGWQFGRRTALFGGPTFNAYVDFTEELRPRLGYGYSVAGDRLKGATVRYWPGFVIGMQF